MIEIKKWVKIPDKIWPNLKYPFNDMDIWDMFEFSKEKYKSIGLLKCKAKKIYKKTFAVRVIDKDNWLYWCWRIK